MDMDTPDVPSAEPTCSGVDSVRIISRPLQNQQSRYGRPYKKGSNVKSPYIILRNNRRRKRISVRGRPCYSPSYIIDPMRALDDDIYMHFLQWIKTSNIFIELETVRMTPQWISSMATDGQWLEDDVCIHYYLINSIIYLFCENGIYKLIIILFNLQHILEYLLMLSHRHHECLRVIPQRCTSLCNLSILLFIHVVNYIFDVNGEL